MDADVDSEACDCAYVAVPVATAVADTDLSADVADNY